MSYSVIIRRNINSIINKFHSKNTYKELYRKDEKAKTNKVSRKGHVALYVGKGKKRYEVPVKYLSHPSIQKLIILSQHDELETKIDGPIELACTTQFFEELLILVKKYY
jgi:SAUR family protein